MLIDLPPIIIAAPVTPNPHHVEVHRNCCPSRAHFLVNAQLAKKRWFFKKCGGGIGGGGAKGDIGGMVGGGSWGNSGFVTASGGSGVAFSSGGGGGGGGGGNGAGLLPFGAPSPFGTLPSPPSIDVPPSAVPSAVAGAGIPGVIFGAILLWLRSLRKNRNV